MTTRHLGKKVYELVDGRLGREDAVAAMAHLDECPECSATWKALLRDREALQTSGTGIDLSFTQHLLDKSRIAEIARDEPRRHVKAASGRGRNVLMGLGVALLGGGAVLGLLWRLGELPKIDLDFALAADRSQADQVRLYESSSMRESGALGDWLHPSWEESSLIPVDAAVLNYEDGSTVLVATFLSGMDTITVVERVGRLAPGVADDAVTSVAGDHALYVLGGESTSLVFGTGDTVVGLTCECELEILRQVADAFPDGAAQDVWDRLGDGWDTVAEAVTGG